MKISTEIYKDDSMEVRFRLVREGSVFKHKGNVFVKLTGSIASRLCDRSTYSFSKDESVRKTTISYEEVE